MRRTRLLALLVLLALLESPAGAAPLPGWASSGVGLSAPASQPAATRPALAPGLEELQRELREVKGRLRALEDSVAEGAASAVEGEGKDLNQQRFSIHSFFDVNFQKWWVPQSSAGVLPSEMPALWPVEALKAQAVAARSDVLQHMAIKHVLEGFNFTDSEGDRVYGGHGGRHPNADQAVRETAGRVLTAAGRIVAATFSARSALTAGRC